MIMEFDLNIILAVAFGAMGLYLLMRLLVYPLRVLTKIAASSLVGAAFLVAFNFLGGFVGLSIGVNIFTVLTVGFLGAPGLLTLLIIRNILG